MGMDTSYNSFRYIYHVYSLTYMEARIGSVVEFSTKFSNVDRGKYLDG